jgi:hypothetical protein
MALTCLTAASVRICQFWWAASGRFAAASALRGGAAAEYRATCRMSAPGLPGEAIPSGR